MSKKISQIISNKTENKYFTFKAYTLIIGQTLLITSMFILAVITFDPASDEFRQRIYLGLETLPILTIVLILSAAFWNLRKIGAD